MASLATKSDFVSLIAEEVAAGIDRALGYWLGRIELEVVDSSLTTSDRLHAIERILNEYKHASGMAEAGRASA